MSEGVWGIDISKFSVKCIRLEKIKGVIELTDVEVIEYPTPHSPQSVNIDEQVQNALIQFKATNKIKGDKIACSLPGHSAFSRTIKLPPIEDAKIPEVVRYEAKSQIPFDIEEVIWSYQLIERSYKPGEEKEVVLFAIKRDTVEQFLENIEPIGINVDIVQFAPVALYNFLVKDKQVGETCIVVDAGADNTDLIIIDGAKFWIRNIPITGNDFTKAIQKALDVSFVEAEQIKVTAGQSSQAFKIFNVIQPVLKDFIGELYRSLGWYKSISRQTKFDKIILLGNAAKTINFQRYISQSLGLNTILLSQLNTVTLGEGIDIESLGKYLPTLGCAIGLALQGLDETPNKVNLLPPQHTKKRELSRKKPFVAAAIALLYLFVFLLYFNTKSDVEKLKSSLSKVRDIKEVHYDIQNKYNNEIDVEYIKKPLDNISLIGYEKDFILKFIGKLNTLLPNNEKLEDKERLWILDLKLEEKRKTDILTCEKELNVFIVCAITKRKTDTEGLNFVKQKIVGPIEKEYQLKQTPDANHKGDFSELSLSLDKRGDSFSRFEINFTIPISKTHEEK